MSPPSNTVRLSRMAGWVAPLMAAGLMPFRMSSTALAACVVNSPGTISCTASDLAGGQTSTAIAPGTTTQDINGLSGPIVVNTANTNGAGLVGSGENGDSDTGNPGGTGPHLGIAYNDTTHGISSTNSNIDGLHAETVGGNGGSGAASANLDGGGGLVELSDFGQPGGAGGAGGNIVIDNFAPSINVSGFGVYGGSYGGAGGDGGKSGDVFNVGTALVQGGGAGGIGGAGGLVTITNHAGVNRTITTSDNLSHAVFGISSGGHGGMGGQGGVGNGFNGGDGGDGGAGGAGGAGNTVIIANSHILNTSGTGSMGLLGASISGNGGLGGAGAGGNGGAGGAVQLSNVGGSIHTTGSTAQAIAAISAGGNAGNGNAGGDGDGDGAGNITAAGGNGGNGGNGGAGGDIAIANAQVLTTQGSGAVGILARSQGGLGALGGGPGEAHSVGDTLAGVAGVNGVGGAGGIVWVQTSNNITTQGAAAHGVMAQSLGGTGLDINVDPNFYRTPTTPGLNSAGAGAVTVLSGSDINVGGSDAYGIIAQSIAHAGGYGGTGLSRIGNAGGGGTYASGPVTVQLDAGSSITTSLDNGGGGVLAQSISGGGGFGTGVNGTVGGDGGGTNTGDGGIVQVINNGDAMATGGTSIHAQSIGGGGGIGGGYDGSFGFGRFTGLTRAAADSAGNAGNAGAVTVQSNIVSTTGLHAAGIFALSVAESGSAGPVTVTSALVRTTGAGGGHRRRKPQFFRGWRHGDDQFHPGLRLR